MNLAEEPHQNADSSVSWVHCRSAVFRISKPLLSKFITPSSLRQTPGVPEVSELMWTWWDQYFGKGPPASSSTYPSNILFTTSGCSSARSSFMPGSLVKS